MNTETMNMLRPAVSELIKPEDSTYALAVGIAKRAREITQESNDANEERLAKGEKKIPLDVKPVSTAIQEFYNGKFRIILETPDGRHKELTRN